MKIMPEPMHLGSRKIVLKSKELREKRKRKEKRREKGNKREQGLIGTS